MDFSYYPKFEEHDFNDLEYWSKRWSECFPCTYPPELFKIELYYQEDIRPKLIQIIFPRSSGPYTRSVCARCGERIMTGHMCKDILEYINDGWNDD